jgi:hypothetical protein
VEPDPVPDLSAFADPLDPDTSAHRALRAAVVDDATFVGLVSGLPANGSSGGPSWRLFGICPLRHPHPAVGDASGDATGMCAVHLRLPHPVDPARALVGLVAAEHIVGLVLVSSPEPGWCKTLGVVADGRWLVGSGPFGRAAVEVHDAAPAAPPDADLAAILARVLGMAVRPRLDPRELSLRIVAYLAHHASLTGGGLDEVVRLDPVTIAVLRRKFVSPDPVSLTEHLSELTSRAHGRIAAGSDDWADLDAVAGFDHSAALDAAAGIAQLVSDFSEQAAVWWGREALANHLTHTLADPSSALAAASGVDAALAATVERAIESRRVAWNLEPRPDGT